MKQQVLPAIQAQLKLPKFYYFSATIDSIAKSPQACGNRRKTFKLCTTATYPKIFSFRAFSRDVTAAILVFQNNETAAMLVYNKPVLWEFNSFLM